MNCFFSCIYAMTIRFAARVVSIGLAHFNIVQMLLNELMTVKVSETIAF